jgi:hypothetical protein
MMRSPTDNDAWIESADDRLLWEQAEWTHLPEFILVRYVDETLEDIDREIVEGHLSECAACLADVRDLRQLRQELAAYPAAAPAQSPSPPFARSPVRFRSVWPVLAGAAVAAALLWIAVVLPLGGRLAESDQRAAQFAAVRDRAEAGRAAAEKASDADWQELQRVHQERDRLSERLAALTPHPTPSPVAPPQPSPAPRVVVRRPAEPALPATVERLIAAAHLPVAGFAALQTTPTVRRGAEGQPPLPVLGPAATKVLPDRPVFRWLPVADADYYQVLVADEKDNILAKSPAKLTATFWQAPARLSRGKPLKWEVYAFSADGKQQAASATSRFLILPEGEAKRLEEARSRRSVTHPLAWAALAAQAGLRAEAEATLLSVLESPSVSEGDRDKARRWLGDVRDKATDLPTPAAAPSPAPEARRSLSRR